MAITWLNIGGILFLQIFPLFFKFLDTFFKVKPSIVHILRMVGPNDVNRKGTVLIIYLVRYAIVTSHLAPDLDFGFFKVKFWNSCISAIVYLIVWNEQQANLLVWLCDLAIWPHP